MSRHFHSVNLNEDKCMGCTNCIKRCPTEAIRVRKSKARIIKERCIDCGECIRVCPYHAKTAISDPIESINDFKIKVALPAPALYGQFKDIFDIEMIINALYYCGFDYVYEVARAAEIISHETKKILKSENIEKPVISSACPAVIKLIQVRFPSLLKNLLPVNQPVELAARMAKDQLVKDFGYKKEDIGVFFITPCAAKVTSIKSPFGNSNSWIDGAISIKDLYLKILSNLKKAPVKTKHFEAAGFVGVRWANSGGESSALNIDKFLAVDGIHNVVTILEQVEDDKLQDVDFIEALSCTGGCLGGPLTVENQYVSRSRLNKIIQILKDTKQVQILDTKASKKHLLWTKEIGHIPVLKLDEDMSEAMKKLEKMEQINEILPGLDCGACGAPNCKALAEDIVRGMANETDCIFKLREKVRELAREMVELESKMPPVLDKSPNLEKETGEK